MDRGRVGVIACCVLLAMLGPWLSVRALAEPPAEASGVRFADGATLEWNDAPGADTYNVYRGTLAGITSGAPARCHGYQVAAESFPTPGDPPADAGYVYLVTADSAADGEGTPGSTSAGPERALLGACGPVMRNHVLDRIGYGWDEWSADRVAALGIDAYIDEQLAPATIDESTNAELNVRLAPYGRPGNVIDLVAVDVIRATYARRQLEQQVAAFWSNHFNTYWSKIAEIFQALYPPCIGDDPPPQCDPGFVEIAYREATLSQLREMDRFRDLGFNGNFREIVEASATSVAMILYLDSYANVAGAPNENHSRELLELYAMGVDNGYTQADVEELARALTGWTVCTKALGDVGDPLAACFAKYWETDPPREWTATFVPALHDCASKTLFAGTPYQAILPDTCATPEDGVDDLYLALDAIVAHPATAEFISTKLLQRFVTEEPDAAALAALTTAWNDAGNPHGVGDLGAVLRAATDRSILIDPDGVGGKIRTPFEQFVAGLRAVRGSTDGATAILDYLVLAQHIPHLNEVPTGWPELGLAWIDTNNTLTRQDYGFQLSASNDPEFRGDIIALLQDHGVSTAPGNAGAIVDFFTDALFGGALTPAERQAVVDYLDTDDLGNPDPYDDARIREAVGVLLGYPQFQEQ